MSQINKKATLTVAFFNKQNYLFITYIVTSKPKRISVAAGVVHMIISFKLNSSLLLFINCYNVSALCAAFNMDDRQKHGNMRHDNHDIAVA
jgi:hypothetical protein